MVVNHSFKLSFDFSLLASAWKIVRQKKPSRHVQKCGLKRLYLQKNCTFIKAFYRASFSGEGAIFALWKNVTQNNPIFARRKTDLKRGFTPKKAYAYKAPSRLVFQTARVGSRRAFFPCGNFRAYNSAAQSCYASSLPQGEYAIPKIKVRQKSTGNFHAYTLALYHIYLHKSIEIQTFVLTHLTARHYR